MAVKRFFPSTFLVAFVTAAALSVACGASPEDAAATAAGESAHEHANANANETVNGTANETVREAAAAIRSSADVVDAACDADGDGFRSPRCGGNDCCDTDASTYPGSERFFSARNACGNYDYNCDGYEEPIAGLDVQCRTKAFHCGGGGFLTVTPCGAVNTFIDCKWKFGCKAEQMQRVQQCH